MTLLARLLLLIAALAYGAMPFSGMSAMAMPMPSVEHAEMGGMAHHKSPVADVDVSASVDCPHAVAVEDQTDTGQSSKAGWHCSACLMLPVDLCLGHGGPPARAAEAGNLPHPLLSRRNAPLTPPPRA